MPLISRGMDTYWGVGDSAALTGRNRLSVILYYSLSNIIYGSQSPIVGTRV